jgi:hypothetical protein
MGSVITRSEVIARAQNWYGRNLIYCCKDSSRPPATFVTDVDGAHKYGPDCSGVISMAWHVDPGSSGGYSASTLSDISTQITDRTHIKQGDILVDVGAYNGVHEHHAILFDTWQPDHVHFSYYSFGDTSMRHYNGGSGETEGPLGSFSSGAKLASFDQSHYLAYQYNNIVDDPHPGQRADVNSDGRPDLIGKDPNGNLYVYPHTATTTIGSGLWAPRVLVGSGWEMYAQIALANIGKNNSRTTGDGPELIGLDFSGGLYAYPNNDIGALSTATFASRILVGSGWNMYKTFLTGDIDTDGYTDLLGLDIYGGLYAYPNNHVSTIGSGMWGSRIQVGAGWNLYTQVD